MCLSFLKSSVGKKALMAVTGLILYLFVIVHMLGNLQIYLGPDALNSYAEHLESLPMLLWPARAFLLTVLLTHMGTAISLALGNRSARPIGYVHEDTIQASMASRSMVMTGLVIFAFIIYHLMHFTFGVAHPQYCELVDGHGREDVYSMVILSFQDRRIAAVYIGAMLALCAHLGHGGLSAMQSLGFNDKKKFFYVQTASLLLAVAVFVGNSSIAISSMMGWIQPLTGGR